MDFHSIAKVTLYSYIMQFLFEKKEKLLHFNDFFLNTKQAHFYFATDTLDKMY